jgi:nucleoside-diphosphate-sugar epimerase
MKAMKGRFAAALHHYPAGGPSGAAANRRKLTRANSGDSIDIWGDRLQARSFLYIDECIAGRPRQTRSSFERPANIGSDELVTISQLMDYVADIAGKKIERRHIPGPTGVRGRTGDNRVIDERLGWWPSRSLRAGLERTCEWIERQVRRNI